jgi:hypothetical protein
MVIISLFPAGFSPIQIQSSPDSKQNSSSHVVAIYYDKTNYNYPQELVWRGSDELQIRNSKLQYVNADDEIRAIWLYVIYRFSNLF